MPLQSHTPSLGLRRHSAKLTSFLAGITLQNSASWDYERYWVPASEEEARNLIIEPYVSAQQFEASGLRDAERIRKVMPNRESILLDFGCGIGRVIRHLTDYRKVYGVDASREMLKLARGRIHQNNVEFLRPRGLTLPLPGGSVDLVFSLLTLQHIDRRDVKRFIGEFQRVLRAGGRCYLHFPEYGDGERGRETRPYSEQQVRQLLKDFDILGLEREEDPPGWVNVYVLAERRSR